MQNDEKQWGTLPAYRCGGACGKADFTGKLFRVFLALFVLLSACSSAEDPLRYIRELPPRYIALSPKPAYWKMGKFHIHVNKINQDTNIRVAVYDSTKTHGQPEHEDVLSATNLACGWLQEPDSVSFSFFLSNAALGPTTCLVGTMYYYGCEPSWTVGTLHWEEFQGDTLRY